jgi:hypothetical protein
MQKFKRHYLMEKNCIHIDYHSTLHAFMNTFKFNQHLHNNSRNIIYGKNIFAHTNIKALCIHALTH